MKRYVAVQINCRDDKCWGCTYLRGGSTECGLFYDGDDSPAQLTHTKRAQYTLRCPACLEAERLTQGTTLGKR